MSDDHSRDVGPRTDPAMTSHTPDRAEGVGSQRCSECGVEVRYVHRYPQGEVPNRSHPARVEAAQRVSPERLVEIVTIRYTDLLRAAGWRHTEVPTRWDPSRG